ncbi:MAG: hypothetical protein ACI85O_003288 [Saprospiraceae bacterium]|jgi:hypothetical protein
MKRILHYLNVRRRAIKFRRISKSAATSTMKTLVRRKEIYTDDGDLGYC